MRGRVQGIVFVVVVVAAFVVGRVTVPPPAGIVVRRSAPGWIGVYRNGEIENEWGEGKDPELYTPLDKLLREDGSLYDQPTRNAGTPKPADAQETPSPRMDTL